MHCFNSYQKFERRNQQNPFLTQNMLHLIRFWNQLSINLSKIYNRRVFQTFDQKYDKKINICCVFFHFFVLSTIRTDLIVSFCLILFNQSFIFTQQIGFFKIDNTVNNIKLHKISNINSNYNSITLQEMDTSNKKHQLGITRGRFSDFLKSKGKRSLSQARKRFSKTSLRKTIDEDEMVQSTLLNYSTKTSELQLSEINEPSWMSDYRKCNFILVEVDGILEEIKEQKIKKMTSINEEKHNRIIEKLYSQASSKVQQCEKTLKGIQKGSSMGETVQQKKILANTLMSLAMKIRQKAKQIRSAQQQDLYQRQSLKKFSTVNLQCNDLMNKDPDEESDWLSQQGFQALQEQLSNQRNQQILKIVSSIHSLNTIYKELQDVVIQQGSLLDRIDQNITTAAFNIKEANQHLIKAEEHQRSPLANRVIFVLVLLIVLFTLILAFR